MKSYTFTVPFAGYFVHEVKAESEDEARDKLNEIVSAQRIVPTNGAEELDHSEWDTYEQMVRGNVCYVPVTEESVEVEDIDDDEEDAS